MFVRVVTHALAIVVALAGQSPAAPSSRISCDRCVTTIAGTRVTFTGTVLPVVDFTARTPRWTIGELAFRDVVVDAHERDGAIHACAAGTLFGARLVACASLPRSLSALRQLRGIQVAWRVTRGDASGHGDARVAWGDDDGEIRLDTHVELALPARISGLALAGATASAKISGTLSPLALSIDGRARADILRVASLHARDVELPIDVRVELDHDALEIAPRVPIAARAESATIDFVHVIAPVLALHDVRPFTIDALATDSYEVAWTAIAGLPVDLGAGSAAVTLVDDGVRVDHTRLDAFGGGIAIDPFEIRADTPTTAWLHLRGLALGDVVDLVTRGRVYGTGVLDGDVEVRRDASGLEIERAELRARARGDVHVRAPGKLAGPVGNIATALADFAYDRLALVVRAPGNDPESTLVLHGRGEHLPQELDLTVNLHGARVAARSFVSRVGR